MDMEEDNAGGDDGSVMDSGRGRTTVRDPLTFAIIGAAQKVHRTLGPGFKESTYQHAMEVELRMCEIRFATQPEYDVMYEGVLCGKYQADLVVENRVVLELKAVSALSDEHIAQALSYLRASGLPVVLLINFGAKSLTWKRFQN
jgi:GxxExxY protein